MKKALLSILGAWLITFSSSPQVMSVKIRVVFPFDVSNVILKQYYPASNYPSMNNTGTNEYSYESLTDSFGQFVFNISYYVPQYLGGNLLYLTGFTGTNSNARPAGIIYGKLYVNNTLLNSIYTTLNQTADGLNVSLRILPDSSVIPLIDSLHPHTIIDDRIPPEVAHRYFYKNAFPSNDHHNLTAWVQVLTDNNCIDTCQVDVDYLKVSGRKSGILTTLVEDDYNTFNQNGDGGLFLRYPFFPPGDYHEHPFPDTLNGGIMTFYPTNNIKRVWHWWNSQPANVSDITQYDSYRVECRMKIKGHALAQVGLDFINPSDNHYELGTGNWVFENPGEWQDVIFDSQDNTCFEPAVVTASSISATTVTISWTAPSPLPGSGYEYEIRTSGAPGSGAGGLTVTGTTPAGVLSAAIFGLSPNTTYYVYVRSSCGGGSFSPWSTPATQFVTPVIDVDLAVQAVVLGGQSFCYDALETITVAGAGSAFVVFTGGSAIMIAGLNIHYLSGTLVTSGGYMHGYIAPGGPFCITPIVISEPVAEDVVPPAVTEKTFFKIYPNPTTGNFTLEQKGENQYGNVRVEVYGLRGDKVLNGEMIGERSHVFSLSERTPGIYFIHVASGTNVEVFKIIKY